LLISLYLPTFAQLNLSYVGDLDYNLDVSDIWGYVAPDDTEYAIVGIQNGVSVVSLADPTNPTEAAFVNGASSIWRDIKTWGNFAYVINETSNGLAVIDLSGLPDSVSSYNWTPNLPGLGTLSTCHNIWIDEFGFAYIVGCNLNGGGGIILNVDTESGEPEFVAAMPPEYCHDIYVRDNKAYNSEINIGQFTIYDVSDKQNIQTLGGQNTEFNFTHNSWPSDDGNTLFTTDELANAPVGSYDVSDPSNIIELDQFRPGATLGDGVIPHNVHVWDDWIIISYYTDGCIIVDGSRPDNLVEVGNFDTYIPQGTGFNGAWGAYPFLPSGLVLVADIGDGLFVLEPNYVRAGFLEGTITDLNNSNPIQGARVQILNTTTFEDSDNIGIYKTGIATAGTYDVQVSKPGYQSFTGSVFLQNDSVTILDVELEPLPSFPLSGSVLDANTGQGVPGAKVNISNAVFSFDIIADDMGDFNIAAAFEGNYDLYAGLWGYQTKELLDIDVNENSGSITIEVEPGYADPFQLDLGWTTSSNANNGAFERAVPFAVFLGGANYFITPEFDVADDIGNRCYVTDNGGDFFANSLYNGNSKLKSPTMDLSTYNEPMMSYSTFIFSVNFAGQNPSTGSGNIKVNLSNDFESETVETINPGDIFVVTPGWIFSEINILEFIGSSPDSLNNLQLEFEANSPGQTQLSEMAVDDIIIWDANPTGIEVLLEPVAFKAMPNPTRDVFTIEFELKDYSSDTQLIVYNALGQTVHQALLTDQRGNYVFGEKLEAGVYFAHITQNGQSSKTILLLKK
jgi:choice-of-anchor B domain-containing protein